MVNSPSVMNTRTHFSRKEVRLPVLADVNHVLIVTLNRTFLAHQSILDFTFKSQWIEEANLLVTSFRSSVYKVDRSHFVVHKIGCCQYVSKAPYVDLFT